MVSTSTISTSTNFIAIGIKLVLVEIGYVVLTSTNFAQYDFFKIPKIVLSEDPMYCTLETLKADKFFRTVSIKNTVFNFSKKQYF